MEIMELDTLEMDLVDGGVDWQALGRMVGAAVHEFFCPDH